MGSRAIDDELLKTKNTDKNIHITELRISYPSSVVEMYLLPINAKKIKARLEKKRFCVTTYFVI